jgi:hypothetical protein
LTAEFAVKFVSKPAPKFAFSAFFMRSARLRLW